jgi:integrase
MQQIFTTASQSPPSPSNLRRSLLAICKDASVSPINVHGLRHVAAALAFRATGDPYAVQHRLGHSHISVTMGIYAYGTRSDDQVAGALDALLAPKQAEEQGKPPGDERRPSADVQPDGVRADRPETGRQQP